MPARKPVKIESIQFLRALAVALVVYAHISDTPVSDFSSQKKFYYLENWGAIGLDLFYVISGFIMTMVTPAYIQSKDWKDFIIKRILRIIPLYWTLSGMSIALILLKGSVISTEKIIKTLLFIPFPGSEFIFPIIPVGWSLSLEVYFYLLIAILIYLTGKQIYRVLIAILIMLAVTGYLINSKDQFIQFLFSPLLIEFALGIIAGLIYKKIAAITNERLVVQAKLLAAFISILGFSLMLTSLFTGYLTVGDAANISENSFLALIRALIWGIPTALFLTGFILLECLFKLKLPAFFVKLGDASYSCYLIHTTLLIPIALKVTSYAGIKNADFIMLFTLVFVLAGSVVFYNYFEKILNSLVIKTYHTKRQTAIFNQIK